MRNMSDNATDKNESTRRNFIWKGLLALSVGLLGKKALAAEDAPKNPKLQMEGDVMRTGVYQGRPQPMEPLDTMIRYERSDNTTTEVGTQEILSLMHEQKGAGKSYPWTIYAHLTTSHGNGDACVLCSRLTKNGRGWSTGLHSELFNHGPMVGLGMNIEMTNYYKGPEPTVLIGMNIQMLPGNPMQYGIQVHGEGQTDAGIGVNGKGKIGVDMGGKYDTGINMRGNTIRLNEGTCIELDGAGKVKMRYLNGRIEFLNGDKCVGHLDMKGEDHSL